MNTLLDFIVFNVLLWLFRPSPGWPLIFCNSLGFLVASVNSYLLNRRWTFRYRRKPSALHYLKFLLLALVGLALNNLTIYLLVSRFMPPEPVHAAFWTNLAKVCATGITFAWNLSTSRLLIFRQKG